MKYKHLTREERFTISCLKIKGHSTSFITAQLARSKSTIHREIQRNSNPTGDYWFAKASDYASCRSRQASCRSSRINADSWNFAVEMLTTEQWSPDQISSDLRKSKRPPISYVAIYRRIYADKERGAKLHTPTYDNGKEFAWHEMIDTILDTTGYFAHPYSSWECGLNENTNGLIRQYFPKKTNFDNVPESDIALVQDKLNRRPRKCLDRNTPNSIFLHN